MSELPAEIVLKGARLTLRSYRVEDAAMQAEVIRASFAALEPWMPWARADHSTEMAAAWLSSNHEARAKGTAYEFAIVDNRSGTFLGGAGLNHLDALNKVANLGYWVRSDRAKHGIATEAARLLVTWGFRELKLNRIEVMAATENLASQRVAVKLGATREGVLRRKLELHGRAHDAVLFSLIPSDIEKE